MRNTSRVTIDREDIYALVQSLLPEIATGIWVPRSFSIVETRKHHSKTLVFCHLVYSEPTVEALEEIDLVVKFYSKKSEADRSCAALRYLWQAGFDSNHYHVPRLYGCEPKRGVLIQQQAAGLPWSQWLQQAPALSLQAAAQAAGWLVQLQRTPAPQWMPPQRLSRIPYKGMAAPRTLLQELAAFFPAYASRLDRIGEQLQQRRYDLQGLPALLAHGDFHPGNVLFTPGQITLIDFDAYGLHEAAFDVGYCIGQLLSMSYFLCGNIMRGVEAANRFWQSYTQEGYASWQHVSIETACALVQVLHYALCTPYAARARTEMLALWLDLIEQWMACEDPSIFARLTVRSCGKPQVEMSVS